MVKQKRKTRRPMDAVTAEAAQAKSEVESFGQRWGMELTSRETERVVEQALSRAGESEGDVKIRPAVRDQMFAMLIEKDPAKAISFRMDMYRKRGRGINEGQMERIREIAEGGGFRRANEELKAMFRGKGLAALPRRVEGRKEAAAPSLKKNAKAVRTGGKPSMDSAYRSAMRKNRELNGVLSKCRKELSSLEREYYGSGGKMKKAPSKREGERLVREYRTRSREIQGKYENEANRLKAERDSYAREYIRLGTGTMIGENKMGTPAAKKFVKEQARKIAEFAGASSVGKEYGVKKFRGDDLDVRGAAEQNVGNFESRLRKWEEERKKRSSA